MVPRRRFSFTSYRPPFVSRLAISAPSITYPPNQLLPHSIQVHQWSVEDRLLHVQLETLGTPSSWRELIAGAFTKRPVPTISGLPILQGQQHDLQHSEATSYRPTPTDIGTSVTAQAVEYAATSSHLLTASRHLIHRVGMHPKDEDCHIHGPGTPFINEDLSLPSVHVDIVMNTDTQKHLTCNLDLLQNPVALEDGNQAVTLVSAPIQHNGDVAHIIAVTHVAETSGLVPGPETAPNARVTSNYDKIYIPGH